MTSTTGPGGKKISPPNDDEVVETSGCVVSSSGFSDIGNELTDNKVCVYRRAAKCKRCSRPDLTSPGPGLVQK